MEETLTPNLAYNLFYWIDAILFFIYTATVLYLLLYAFVSRLNNINRYPIAAQSNKIAVVYLSFSTDWDIKECLSSYFNQDYPSDKYKIFVVGQDISDQRLDAFKEVNVSYIVCDDAKLRSTLLSAFISELDSKEKFDFVAIHKIYDRVDRDFLSSVNNALYSGCDVVQTHCKNGGDKSIWDVYKTISSEINNSIFRRAHCRLSLSSALSDTGMIMSVKILKMCLKKRANIGIEKQFERVILQNNYYIEYLDDVSTYSCKKHGLKEIYSSQKRVYSYTLNNMSSTIFHMPFDILKGNIDYLNKLVQWILPPRIALIMIVALMGVLTTFVDILTSVKWWTLLILLLITFYMAIPTQLTNGKFIKTVLFMPIYMLIGNKFKKAKK